MTHRSHSNIGRADFLATLANSSRTPDLKVIGIQLLECLLVPAAATVVLAIMMWALYRWWKNRQAAKKAAKVSNQVEEGLQPQQGHQDTLQIPRPASPHFKHPDVNGRPTIPVLPDSNAIDFAFSPPPTPRFRGLKGAGDIQEISLGESTTAPPSVSVFDFAFSLPAPPPTRCLHGVEGTGEIETIDLGESATAE
jgi:hypothetical protein